MATTEREMMPYKGYRIIQTTVDLAEGGKSVCFEGFEPDQGASIGHSNRLGGVQSKIDEHLIQKMALRGELEIKTISIADAVPSEKGYVAPVLEGYKRRYAAGETVDLPEAIEIDGEYFIVEGVNRVGAQKELGRREIDVILMPQNDPRARRDVLQTRKAEGRKGFNSMNSYPDGKARRADGFL